MRRSASSAQEAGRYGARSSGRVSWSVRAESVTASWQLAILPPPMQANKPRPGAVTSTEGMWVPASANALAARR